MTDLYQNDSYLNIAGQLEKNIIENTKAEFERKNIITEVDTALLDLQLWRETRKQQEENRLQMEKEKSDFAQKIEQQCPESDSEDEELKLAQRQYEESMKRYNQVKSTPKQNVDQMNRETKIIADQSRIQSQLKSNEAQLSYIED